MENNKDKAKNKNKKFTSTIKNKMFKGYEKVRNKMQNNFDMTDSFQRFSYDSQTNTKYNLNRLEKEDNYSSKTINLNGKFTKNNCNNLNNLSIEHLSKTKKDDYNNTLNKLFFTTSNIFKNKKPNLSFKNDSNTKNTQFYFKENKYLINKLFPDINEINKYSNLPFFSLNKVKSPYKMKLNENNKKEVKKKFPQEEFLYKISHNSYDEEKINYNFIKNKGIKKGRTAKYFHGVDKFCINNKVSETNFMRKEDLKKKKFKLELDVNNLTKGEKIPQISSREKHIKILENNLKSIKLIPNLLMNDLEDDVFKFIDNEFDKINEDSKKNKKEEQINTINNEEQKENGANIVNLSTQFNINNNNKSSSINDKFLQTANEYLKNKSYFNNTNISNFTTTTGFKKMQQYPINFYSTQQIKIKEHFNKTHKNTFEERNKKSKKGYYSERNLKKKMSDEMIENLNRLQRIKITNNGSSFKKECRIRDVIIGQKLKFEFNPVDVKRILNGLKPYADIKSDEEIDKNIENSKIYVDIKKNKEKK